MSHRNRLILAITGLIVFTALALLMICIGQPASVIGSLILAIVLGVTQLLQAIDGLGRRDLDRRVPPPHTLPSAPSVGEETETDTVKNEGRTERPMV
ncbi:hypothetical protein [Streptomyces geranii]|uniref:hypothetical protein n=1 Tax=Streptomyces geranii TaxID=2058923 RepID=UPI000D042925|nr:hypothetical protein [Streptomyces geranii]